jgi:hypothetical protein
MANAGDFFFHKRSRTLILADFIQNHQTAKGKLFQNALAKLDGVAYPKCDVPRDIRLTFTNRNNRTPITRLR